MFLSLFHSLHLFQQFQADCVYKKSLEDACYFLLQLLFQWKMSVRFIRNTCFISFRQIVSIKNLLKMLVTSCYSLYSFSLFQLFQWKMSNFFKTVSFVTLVSAVSGRLCL